MSPTSIEPSLMSFVVAVLAVVVAFVLFLVLRLAAVVSAQAYLRSPTAVPAGSTLPAFSGRRLRDGARLSGDFLSGQAAVLVFLSPDCEDCRRRIAELATLYDAIRRSGVGFFVVSARSKRRMRAFLQDSPLLGHVLLVSAAVRRALNPRNAAPFYIFVDDERRVLASNFIGDADWASFVAQIRESDAEIDADGPGARQPASTEVSAA
ncbi:MAG TPA: redoxin domain-containing protein [Tahibacter sp.]|uniref:peroxiredoxin family protein n=1 Tax=Tahibacter sp. TaxID=2056211 RepID=UPI002C4ADAA1|nr:redoxin domain-containing protein [Tahibacter sp.]HSX59825.1 redoxin domain-containing protein [Tahibacter sp.]